MKTKIQFIRTFLILLSFSNATFAQIPNLRTAKNFVLFTKTGAVGNTGISQLAGNIGTNNGAITGFNLPTTINGTIDSGNVATVQCAADVQTAYNQLFNTAPTSTTHTPAFGGGETLFAGVYAIAAAGSIAGDLTLDAQGNSNAIFIFKFGGAFTTGASSTIHLINGALACNVFWAAEGAIAMATLTVMSGTLISNNGAVSMGASGTLVGRLFSTTGAASVYSVSASLPPCVDPLPIELISFTAKCDNPNVTLKWITASETNNNYFTVERSADGKNWETVGRIPGSGTSYSQRTYTLIDRLPNTQTSFYRLMQSDLDGNYDYGKVITVKKCGDNLASELVVFPNPSRGKFDLLFTENTEQVHSIEIFNSSSQKIYGSNGFQSKFDLSGQAPGVYFMHIQLNLETITKKIIVEQ